MVVSFVKRKYLFITFHIKYKTIHNHNRQSFIYLKYIYSQILNQITNANILLQIEISTDEKQNIISFIERQQYVLFHAVSQRRKISLYDFLEINILRIINNVLYK